MGRRHYRDVAEGLIFGNQTIFHKPPHGSLRTKRLAQPSALYRADTAQSNDHCGSSAAEPVKPDGAVCPEAIAVDENGLSVFDLIRYRRQDHAVTLCASDLLELDGEDLR